MAGSWEDLPPTTLAWATVDIPAQETKTLHRENPWSVIASTLTIKSVGARRGLNFGGEVIRTKEDWSGGDSLWSGGDLLQINTKEDQWPRLVGITIKKPGAGNNGNQAIFTGEEKEPRITNGKEGLPLPTC